MRRTVRTGRRGADVRPRHADERRLRGVRRRHETDGICSAVRQRAVAMRQDGPPARADRGATGRRTSGWAPSPDAEPERLLHLGARSRTRLAAARLARLSRQLLRPRRPRGSSARASVTEPELPGRPFRRAPDGRCWRSQRLSPAVLRALRHEDARVPHAVWSTGRMSLTTNAMPATPRSRRSGSVELNADLDADVRRPRRHPTATRERGRRAGRQSRTLDRPAEHQPVGPAARSWSWDSMVTAPCALGQRRPAGREGRAGRELVATATARCVRESSRPAPA